jgi:hypothetical protein
MTWHFKTRHFAGALIGALMLAVALPAPASAEQNAKTSTAKTNAKTSAKTREAQGRPWTLQDAMPENSASMRQYDTRPASPPIGRVPLQSGPGTLGFETKTQVNPNQTPDGAIIRGQEATAARSSTYVGMSLSVPTTDKAMNFPVPWGKP